jgi:hypothetical protein
MTRAEAGRLAQLYVRTNRGDLAEEQFRRAIASAEEARSIVKDRDLRFSCSTRPRRSSTSTSTSRARNVDDALLITETRRAQTLEEGLAVPAKLDGARSAAERRDDPLLLARPRPLVSVVDENDVRLETLPPDTTIEKRPRAIAASSYAARLDAVERRARTGALRDARASRGDREGPASSLQTANCTR